MPSSQQFLDKPEPRFAAVSLMVECFPEDVQVRLHGTALGERWGEDQTGRRFDKRAPSDEALVWSMWQAVTQPCGLWTVSSFMASHYRLMQVESLALPLAVSDGKPPRLVAISIATDEGRVVSAEEGFEKQPSAQRVWVDIGRGVPVLAPKSTGRAKAP